MDEKLCSERSFGIINRVACVEGSIKEHDIRIDRLEQNDIRLDERLANIATQLSNLNGNLKWLLRAIAVAFIGLIFNSIRLNLI